MPRFAANLTMLFTEMDFRDRFAAARGSGFKAVEFLFPYDYPAAELSALLASNGLEMVLFNSWPGSWEKGERGIAALPGRIDEFRQTFAKSVTYAKELSCRRIHVMAGLVAANETEDAAKCFISNLRWAADQAAGVSLMVEPLNRWDFPGYLVNSIATAMDLINAVDRPNVFLQFDVYHTQSAEGRLIQNLRSRIDSIGHVQVAGVPGRNEPDDGQEINYPYVFRLLDELNYEGWVGCEYRPRSATADGLGWARPWGIGMKP